MDVLIVVLLVLVVGISVVVLAVYLDNLIGAALVGSWLLVLAVWRRRHERRFIVLLPLAVALAVVIAAVVVLLNIQ